MSTITNPTLAKLRQAIHGLEPGDYVDVNLDQSKWRIIRRPTYCNRGRFDWHCESKDNDILTIDSADGFPRYMFKVDSLMNEFFAWCKARKQTILSFEIHGS